MKCWDKTCEAGIEVCCVECEIYDYCEERCNWIKECRENEEE